MDRAALLATIENVLAASWTPGRMGDPGAVWGQLRELGITDLIADQSVEGGMGLPMTILVDVLRVTGRHLAPGPLIEEAFLRPWLASHASLADRRPGDQLALVDPAASFDWREKRGDVHLEDGRLNGNVRAIANAPAATTLIVIAGTQGGDAVCVVEASSPGVSIVAGEALDPGCPIGTVTFDDCVPNPTILANPDAIAELRVALALLIAAELRGIAEAVVEMSRSYALQRHQFDRPIAAFQAIKHLLADMAAQSIALGNLVDVSGSELAGRAALPLAERRDSAAIVKAFAAAATLQICEQGLQVHGGIGFVEEHPLHRYFKAALRRHGLYGTPAELHRLIGAAAVGAP
jgi:alkylation response protein AidB-like acyl-CoA dehydrogenase